MSGRNLVATFRAPPETGGNPNQVIEPNKHVVQRPNETGLVLSLSADVTRQLGGSSKTKPRPGAA